MCPYACALVSWWVEGTSWRSAVYCFDHQLSSFHQRISSSTPLIEALTRLVCISLNKSSARYDDLMVDRLNPHKILFLVSHISDAFLPFLFISSILPKLALWFDVPLSV